MADKEKPPEEHGPNPENWPVELDSRRGMAAQKATVERRLDRGSDLAVETRVRRQLDELEAIANAAPAETWAEAAGRAAGLIRRFAETTAGQDPRCVAAIARTLDDLARFAEKDTPPGEDRS